MQIRLWKTDPSDFVIDRHPEGGGLELSARKKENLRKDARLILFVSKKRGNDPKWVEMIRILSYIWADFGENR